MELSPPVVLGLLSLPMLLVGLVLYLRRRWVERSVQHELEQIGRRLSPDDLQARPEPMVLDVLDAGRFAEFYRRIARADLKVGAFLARLGHGEVDLDEKLETARRSLRGIVDFEAEQRALSQSEWRSAELIAVLEQSEALLTESTTDDAPGEGEPDEPRLVDAAAWGRLAETLQRLRAQLRQEFNAKGIGDVDSAS